MFQLFLCKSTVYKKSLIVIILLLLLFSTVAMAYSNDTVFVEDEKSEYSLGERLEYLEDKEGKWGIDDIASESFSGQWVSHSKKTVGLGYTNSVYWFRVSLKNIASIPKDFILALEANSLDLIDIYYIDVSLTETNGKILRHFNTGDSYSFDQRPFKYRNFVFPVTLSPQEDIQVYVRVKSSGIIFFPLNLMEKKAFLQKAQFELFAYGFLFGIMVAMILYNLIIYFIVKESSYLYYVFFVFFNTFYLLDLLGFSYQYIWPNAIWLRKDLFLFAGALTFIFGILFTIRFLEIKNRSPILYRIAQFFNFIWIGIFFFLFINPSIIISFFLFFVLLTCVFGLIIGIWMWIKGFTAARYFTIAWSILIIGAFLFISEVLGLVPSCFLATYSQQIGTAVQVILLSFALADRINQERNEKHEARLETLNLATKISQERKEKIEAQQKALINEKAAREAKEKALEIQLRATEMLELKVKERTRELQKAL
ncbi:hypothetical protein KKA14_08250, partial [bacterium]|nr:hypothetical protein [bacterium]